MAFSQYGNWQRSSGRLDDPIDIDGDGGFKGLDSYHDATSLPQGMVAVSENMRFDGGKATVRKGVEFRASAFDFTYSAGVDEVFASGVVSDVEASNRDYLLAATKTKALLFYRDSESDMILTEDSSYLVSEAAGRLATKNYDRYVDYYSATFATGDVNTSNETFTESSHKYQTGDAVQISSTTTIPAGLSADTTYYVIDASSSTIKLATTLVLAKAGTAINLTSQGAGVHTIQTVVTDSMKASVLQANDKVLIFRPGARPLEWDGSFTDTNGDGTVDSVFAAKTTTASASNACPEADWGIWVGNRLIVPTADTLDTGVGNNPQTILVSDILDDNEFVLDGEFYMNKGSADYVVGAISYQEDQVIVFNRRSIHMISGIRNTSTAVHTEITRQYGCVSRKSICQQGPFTYFLSDNGIYVLAPGYDPAKTGTAIAISKVAPLSTPLSRPINDVMDSVNFDDDTITKAVAIVHENKVFCALPVTDGTDQDNTIIMVYDLLLEAWVSKDFFTAQEFDIMAEDDSYLVTEAGDGLVTGTPDFVIDNFVITSFGEGNTKNRLFIVNDKGWWLYGENESDDANRMVGTDGVTTTPIQGKLVTRGYTMSNVGVKKFMTGQIASSISLNDSFNAKAHTSEPDSTSDAVTVTGTADDEILTRFGVSSRGYSAKVEINVTSGRPSFKHVVLEGSSLVLGARAEAVE